MQTAPDTYADKMIGYSKYDVFFVSYPKSGRTWIQFMLMKLYSLARGEEEVTSRILFAPGLPSILFTHDNALTNYSETKENVIERFRGKKVIFLMRDPRDVMVSFYLRPHKTLLENGYFDFETLKPYPINEWIKRGAFEKYLNWMKLWSDVTVSTEVESYVFRYEEFLKRPYLTFYSLIYYLVGLDHLRSGFIEKSIRYASIENMKQLQESKEKNEVTDLLKGRTHHLYLNKDCYLAFGIGGKIRKGIAGDYKEYLNQETIEWCNKLMRESNCDLVKLYEA